ncbi:MAG TPA: DUF4097 family beta strand repeat-containing protein, partial [Mycobacteriales bacterium]|nr:DUF4097 family beta strand repeat-containing protein [Mycobacteriales bacterium]
VKAAEQTRVEYSRGRLSIKTPKPRTLFGRGGSVDVAIELPTGSTLNGTAAVVEFESTGELGECKLAMGSGDIRLDRTGSLNLKTGNGDVTVDHIAGDVNITTGSGDVHVGEVTGSGSVKNASGDTRIDKAGGELRVKAASGDISVGLSGAAVDAKTASGDISVGEAADGEVAIDTASGDLEVGIREGTAAWLNLRSLSGKVRNSLETADGPELSDATVKVRARTLSGDITIRRS